MNIAIVGSVVDEKEVIQYSGASVAGNKMQLGFIRSLSRHVDEVQVISIEPHQQWNGKGKVVVFGGNKTIDNKIPLKNGFFINALFIKQITICFSIFFNLFGWGLRNYKDKEKVIIVYNTISYFAIPVLLISSLFNCRSLAIVADLPIKSPNKNIIKRFEDFLEVRLIKRFNLLIPLTEMLARDFGRKQAYLVIEAGIEERMIQDAVTIKKESKQFNIVFSGSLNELSGIELAIKAMNKIKNNNIKLNIYGKGLKENLVKEAMKDNQNIIYHGTVSNTEIMEIQKKADLLISPRKPDDTLTKYTFPSKIVEYMASGVPVLCNKLSGIPTEYYKYIIALDSPDELLWAKTIVNIYGKDYRVHLDNAEKAKLFIYNNKTWEKQGEKIYKFLVDNINPN